MPTYEYECPDCSLKFELRRSFSDDGQVSCPQCGCEAQRIFSPVPIIFKGSGFYVTDSRNSSSHIVSGGNTEKDKAAATDEAGTASTAEAKTGSAAEAGADSAGSAKADSTGESS